MSIEDVVISLPIKKKLNSEEFRKRKEEEGILELMFKYNLYNNWEDVMNLADEIDMNIFFMMQDKIHPIIEERFSSCVNSSVRYLISISNFLGKKKINEKYEIDYTSSFMVDNKNENCGNLLANAHNSNSFGDYRVMFRWTDYKRGETSGEFTYKITIYEK